MTETQITAETAIRPTFVELLRQEWDSLDRVQKGLIGLVALRLVIALAFMLNIIPLELRFRWFLHHGGDQDDLLALAVSIIEGRPTAVLIGIGGALIMIPLILLYNTHNYFEFVVPIVLLNGFLMGGLSVWLTGQIARRITGDDRVALWSAGLWAALPLVAYYSLFWHFDWVTVRSAIVPKLGWLNMLADGPTVFFMLVATALLAGIIDEEPRNRLRFWRMTGVGVAMAIAVMYRIHIAPMVAFLLLYVLITHGWRNLLVVCLAGLIAYTPQAWYNQTVFGMPITSGYSSYWDILIFQGQPRPFLDRLRFLPFHPRHVLELLEYYLGRRPWLGLPLLLLSLSSLSATILLWQRRGWRAVALLVGAPAAYMGLMVTAWPFRDDVVRFSMLSFPFVIILFFYTLFYLRDMRVRKTC